MEELIRETDRVYHMASAVGVKLIMERPVRTIETIFRGTDVVLGFCSRYRKRVLIPSTSEVYGKGASVPFKEDDDLLTGAHRQASMGIRMCENALTNFSLLHTGKRLDFPSLSVRLFNTVGPRQTGQYGMVVPRFVHAAIRNEPIQVHGDGTQSRCFGHVHDIVEGLTKLLDSPECFGQVINIGNSEETSIKGLCRSCDRLDRK
jgi:UDP-glucose 4-epimerase